MNKYPFILIATLSFNFCFAKESSSISLKDKKIVEKRIPSNNFRYNTFIYSLALMNKRKASTIVETGTARCGADLANGGSTLIFGEWAKNHRAKFYSVDISPQSIQNAAEALGDLKPFVNLVCSDSVSFLKSFSRPIDFLYLDSMDLDLNNPIPSQEHHLKEIMAAYPWLTSNSVVMIDDCDFPCGGKGKLVIEYLVNRGWQIVASGYQVILTRKKA